MGPPPPADIGLSPLFTGNDILSTTTAPLLGRPASISVLLFLETEMSYMVAQDRLPNLAERSYRRGLRELLDKEVVFRSPVEGVFFVNIRCMFNGDRLAFVKAYHLKGSGYQPELQLEAPKIEEGAA